MLWGNNKWYYDIISVKYFQAIVLQFFVHLSYFPTSTSVLNGLVCHIWEQLNINKRKIALNIFLFLFIPIFYNLALHVLGKVRVKSRGQFGVLKYNTFFF